MAQPLTTDEGVSQVNDLARRIAEWERATHPSAWPELLADLHHDYQALAARQTADQPRLPGMD